MREFIARKKLLKAAKALWLIFQVLVALVRSVKGFHKTLHNNKTIIVDAIRRTAEALTTQRACRYLGITTHQYHNWKTRQGCRTSALHLCRRKQPNQLSSTETLALRKFLSDPRFLFWSAVSIYHQILRDGIAAMSISTFYNYLGLLQLTRIKLHRKETRNYKPLRASAPLQIRHMDVTVLRTADNIKTYIYIVQDNFSRAILSITASLQCNSRIAMQNLRNAISTLNLWNTPIQLITDDGSENKGEVIDFLLREDVDIEKLIAQIDIRSSNSMIEAANKRLKYDFLFRKKPPDFSSLFDNLPQIREEFNNKPLNALYGLTPTEVLSGMMPDKTRIQTQIAKAKQERIAHNQKSNCQICI